MKGSQKLTRCHYVIIDSFPRIEGTHFKEYVGAVVGCWVPTGASKVDHLIERRLLEEGWEIAGVIGREIVDDETYATKKEGADQYRQALAEGFAAHFFVRNREIISLAGLKTSPELSARKYDDLLYRLRRERWGLYSRVDDQWANGVSFDEDDFLPLWTSKESAAKWRCEWPGYEETPISRDELIGESGILTGIADEQMWAAVEIDHGLVTIHPVLLRRDLKDAAAKPDPE